MPRTNVVGTTAPPGSGAQTYAQAGEREHRTDSTAGTAVTTAANRLKHRRARPEAQLQRSLVEHLRWSACSDVWWAHIPNGGVRTAIEGAIFKSLGVQPGAPDLLIVRAGQALFVELKAPGRKLSPNQVECHEALRRAGATVETADNIDQALAFLRRLGVLR